MAVAGLAGMTACTPTPVLEGVNREALSALVAEVDQGALMDLVTQVVNAHRAGTKFDCSVFNLQDGPLCNYSGQAAGELMRSRLEALGLRVERQDSSSGRFPTSNIVADLPGLSKPEEIVIIGAHYDAFWDGADDNSTGVATGLEVARVLSQHRFDRTLRFVGFDLEELGLVGSGRFVEAQRGDERTVAALILDCVGYYDSRPGSQLTSPGLPSPETGDFLAVIGNGLSSRRASEVYALNDLLGLMKVTSLISAKDGTYPMGFDFLRSDHTPFWLAGQEALFFTDTANLRNPNYHRTSDTVDTLDAATFRKAVQVSAAAMAYWAGGPR